MAGGLDSTDHSSCPQYQVKLHMYLPHPPKVLPGGCCCGTDCLAPTNGAITLASTINDGAFLPLIQNLHLGLPGVWSAERDRGRFTAVPCLR